MVVILKEHSKYPENVTGIPSNYNFEIQKTLKTIEKLNSKRIALQFPDGLLCYAPVLIDLIQAYFKEAECVVLDDVVYGACCIDDQSLEVDLLVHYGHSCLIPVSEMNTRVLYVFVDIKIDVEHLYKMIIKNFAGTIAIIGTIQFNSSVNRLKRMIDQSKLDGKLELNVPQVKPLSPGEILGCTSPVISGVNDVIYIGDGRFHLESAMIRNPALNFYKYCPFTRKLSQEFYDYEKMKVFREREIKRAFEGRSFGVILGSLGRQGNKHVFRNVAKRIESFGKYKIYKIVLDEINQDLLDNFDFVDAFVQVSCPRLSIDWGVCYRKPLLSPFEVFYEGGEYQMDYYSREGYAPWKNYNNIT
ncbi:diphthamide biosynthesis enzyme Dph1/Dph2 domain-containing protein [Vittaforma corneae ATCC 50505]|uniref:2-(3-amino-3-carboxypropyl)histidine synthase subunit 1 n=1 Tax=Vittaforma corneae (strain ATCC 50505) TaxID=993615 RepID=L2GM30_VITCO|nr:diphthamide biosynthesis enzyme Dph1/Dph2 domain-containing protein [Vittaforma corneae ATCC 50505]ELA41948.1 diphthamide biosynthesis enzyme Dph1/Dph2 domain-containing protein [Vittaforma corneae ATCC 50505]